VIWEDGQERVIHLPYMKYFSWICRQ
jgi:hypothetical protein